MYFLSKTLNVRGKNEKYSGKSEKCKKSPLLYDVTGPQQRNLHMYPIILTSSCRQDKGKNFSKYRKVTKNAKGIPTTTPPPTPLYHGGGMSLHVRPRVKIDGKN